jgi:hypothetical protein
VGIDISGNGHIGKTTEPLLGNEVSDRFPSTMIDMEEARFMRHVATKLEEEKIVTTGGTV